MIPSLAMSLDDSLPTDLANAHALIIAQRQALTAAQERAAAAESEAQYRALLIEKLKFTISKLQHARFGQSSERSALLNQLELQLADLEADAAQADAAAQIAAATASEKMMVSSFERQRPARRPLPEQLPRERIVYPVLTACPCCGGTTLRKIGEDVTETLEHGSATSYRGTGAQNAVPLPDTPLGIETGGFVELPRRALVDLGQLIWAADRSPSFGDQCLRQMGKNSNSISTDFSPLFSTVIVPRANVARTAPGERSIRSPC
jgi:hypothetical protein